jgi:hypothetical protein
MTGSARTGVSLKTPGFDQEDHIDLQDSDRPVQGRKR